MLTWTAGKLWTLFIFLGAAVQCIDGESKSMNACGEYQPTVKLLCSVGDSHITVIHLKEIVASRKSPCPESDTETECTLTVDEDNSYYTNITSQCDGRQSCDVKVMQVTLDLNECSSVWRNYIEIHYDCVPSDFTVPPAGTSAANEGNDSGEGTGATASTNAGIANATESLQSTGDVGINLAALIICMLLLLIVLVLVIVTTIFYRKDKLPKSLQRRISGVIFEITIKLSHISARRRSRPNVYQKRSQATGDRQNPAYVEEEVYCSIDEVATGARSTQYEAWNSSQTPTDKQLPKILVVPNRQTSAVTKEYTDEQDGEDYGDDEWEDSEFDESSDDEGGRPTLPPYMPDVSEEAETTQQYHVLEKDNCNTCPSHCSCEKTTCNVATKDTAGQDEYTYCAPERYRRSQRVAESSEYSEPSVNRTSAVTAEGGVAVYDSPTVNDDTEYYSTAATYREDTEV